MNLLIIYIFLLSLSANKWLNSNWITSLGPLLPIIMKTSQIVQRMLYYLHQLAVDYYQKLGNNQVTICDVKKFSALVIYVCSMIIYVYRVCGFLYAKRHVFEVLNNLHAVYSKAQFHFHLMRNLFNSITGQIFDT